MERVSVRHECLCSHPCSMSSLSQLAAYHECNVFVTKRALTLPKGKQGEVHPRRKDKTPNAPWVAFGVRSVATWRHLKTSSHDKCGEQCSSFLPRPADRGGLVTMVRSLRLSHACERVRLQRYSHVKRVLTDTGGVWRAERHCQWQLTR